MGEVIISDRNAKDQLKLILLDAIERIEKGKLMACSVIVNPIFTPHGLSEPFDIESVEYIISYRIAERTSNE